MRKYRITKHLDHNPTTPPTNSQMADGAATYAFLEASGALQKLSSLLLSGDGLLADLVAPAIFKFWGKVAEVKVGIQRFCVRDVKPFFLVFLLRFHVGNVRFPMGRCGITKLSVSWNCVTR